jgi:predicted RNA-binding protein with TRAM domain
MKSSYVIRLLIPVLAFSCVAVTQTSSPAPAQAGGCPIELQELHVSNINIHVRNTSGKNIVGLVFNVAFSDATERWRWLHWNYDLSRPLQEFGWNKPVKEGETKKLSWNYIDLEHEHGGGVALVLTSVLFTDGTSWEEEIDRATCKAVWYHNHKKGFTRPVELPPRE